MAVVPLDVVDASVEIDGASLLPPTTFAVSEGDVWCVTGPNGSGKTTLLRALMGRRDLTGGSCTLYGEPVDLSRAAQRRLLAALVDPIPIARDMTVREQISMVAASWLGNTDEAVEQVDGIVSELGLADLVDRFPHQLSSGQQQMFALSLALVRPSAVLLLDEPERHLDVDHVALVVSALRRRALAGSSVVVATHDPVVVEAADHQVILD